MSITIKVALLREEGQDREFKQFSITEDVIQNEDIFQYVSSKISGLLQEMGKNIKYTLQWKDEEGDLIDFSSQEEAQLALISAKDGALCVFVKEVPTTKDIPEVVCDECKKPVSGARYVCMVCPDYNMCDTCEAAGHHMEHDVVKLVKHIIPEVMEFPRDSDGEFVPPPRFRRWMNRFARRWHKRNGYLVEANDNHHDANGRSPVGHRGIRKRTAHLTGDVEWTRRDKVLMRLRKKRQRLSEDLNEKRRDDQMVSDGTKINYCSRGCCMGGRARGRRSMIHDQMGKEEQPENVTDQQIGEHAEEETVCKRDGKCCRHQGRKFDRRHHGRHRRDQAEEHFQGDISEDRRAKQRMRHNKRRRCGRPHADGGHHSGRRCGRRNAWKEVSEELEGTEEAHYTRRRCGRRHARKEISEEGTEEVRHTGRRCRKQQAIKMADEKTVFEGEYDNLSKEEDSVTRKLEMMNLSGERCKYQRMNRQQWRCRGPMRRHFRKSQLNPQE